MSCLSDARLAAAASGEDSAAVEHAAECPQCRDALARERDARALVARAPEVRLPSAQRQAMRAELLARLDAGDTAPRRKRPIAVMVGAVLAAAAVVIIVGVTRQRPVEQVPVAALPAVASSPQAPRSAPPEPPRDAGVIDAPAR